MASNVAYTDFAFNNLNVIRNRRYCCCDLVDARFGTLFLGALYGGCSVGLIYSAHYYAAVILLLPVLSVVVAFFTDNPKHYIPFAVFHTLCTILFYTYFVILLLSLFSKTMHHVAINTFFHNENIKLVYLIVGIFIGALIMHWSCFIVYDAYYSVSETNKQRSFYRNIGNDINISMRHLMTPTPLSLEGRRIINIDANESQA